MKNKVSLGDLLKLAGKIRDKRLRKKTESFLKNPSPSNPKFRYKACSLESAPAWIGAHHDYEGGLIKHIYSVTKLCLTIANQLRKLYSKEINRDWLLAASLLHDHAKLWQLKQKANRWTLQRTKLEHPQWTACELYSRGFPEEVVHSVAAHGAETAIQPQTSEALILYYADSLDAQHKPSERIVIDVDQLRAIEESSEG